MHIPSRDAVYIVATWIAAFLSMLNNDAFAQGASRASDASQNASRDGILCDPEYLAIGELRKFTSGCIISDGRVVSISLRGVTTESELSSLGTLKNLLKLQISSVSRDMGVDLLPALPRIEELRVPVSDRGMPFIGKCLSLRILDLGAGSPSIGIYGSKLSDEGLRQLSKLTQLEELDLSGNYITDDGLESLRGLTNLHNLNICFTRIGNKSLAGVNRLTTLHTLNIAGNSLDDDALRALEPLSSLEDLIAYDNRFTDRGMPAIAKLTELHELLLGGCKEISDAGVRHLALLEKLEKLDLSHTSIGDLGLSYLDTLRNLKELNVYGTQVTPTEIARQRTLRPDIEICYKERE